MFALIEGVLFVVFDFGVPVRVVGGHDADVAVNPGVVGDFRESGGDGGDVADERNVGDEGGGGADEAADRGAVRNAGVDDAGVDDREGFAEVGVGVDDFLTGFGFTLKGVGVNFEDFGFNFGVV